MLFLLAMTAHASEIQVTAERPVVVGIDGRPAGIAGTLIDTKDLDPGTHIVQIRSFVGSVLAEASVDLGEDERLRLMYMRATRSIEELDRSPLTSPLPAEVAPSPASTPDPTPLPTSSPTPVRPVVSLSDSKTGSLIVTGVSDISGEVSVAGTPAKFAADAQGYLVHGLPPPVVELHILDNGKLRYHGAIDVTAGGHTACHLQFLKTAWTVQCSVDRSEIPGPSR